MEQAEIARRIVEHMGAKVLEHSHHCGQHSVLVRPADLRQALLFLRDTADLDFEMLMDVGGVDYLGYDDREWRYEVAYQMLSLRLGHRFRVKVAVPDDQTEVPTVWDLWRVANWMEREVWDLFGIRFTGHPNLRRILCHDDFRGHALRKDYPINRRQTLSRPVENLLTDDPEWA
jgi:NADH-quinone oxidoreductase subunit C